jgi:hypothetical protein
MIPDLGACVADLVAELTASAPAGHQVYDHVPEEPAVPAFIVQGSDNVIQADPEGTFRGEYLVTLDVVILVQLDDEHDNEAATAALWEALQALATALEGSDWTLVQVNQPGTLQTLYWQHHGVTATVRTRTE